MGHTRQWIIVTSASLIIVYSSVEIWQPCVWCCCCCCCCGDEKSLDPSMGLVNSPTSSHLWGIWTVKLSNRRTSHTNICRAYTQATADKNAIIPRRGANPSTRGCSPPVHPRSAATEQFKSFYCLYHAICHFFKNCIHKVTYNIYIFTVDSKFIHKMLITVKNLANLLRFDLTELSPSFRVQFVDTVLIGRL